jgi:hypothetical protein
MLKNSIRALAVLAGATMVTAAATPAAHGYVRGCGYAGGYSVSANSVTSCPFARNVARAYGSGYRNPRVYSPVTGRTYQMYCTKISYRTAVCRGGNNAYVRLRR